MNSSWRTPRRRSRTVVPAALLGALLFASGCGSTLDFDALESGASRPAAEGVQPADSGTPSPGQDASGQDASAAVPAADAVTGASSTAGAGSAAAATGGTTPGGSSQAGPATAAIRQGSSASASGASASATPSQSAKQASGTAGPAAKSGAPSPGTPTPAAPTGPKSEIVFGSIGVTSGVIGAGVLPFQQAIRAWAADVNARGGLAGHPVRLIVGDDEADPNKALALARRMVEEQKAIALIAGHSVGTTATVLKYLEQRKVPMIEPCFCEPPGSHSPMGFPVVIGSDYGLSWAHILPLTAMSDKRKISIIFCREAPICQNMRNRVHEFASTAGVQIVNESQASLAQPDFTAEVLAAKNAGADAVVMMMENASDIRIARAAHRQGWNPLLVTQGHFVDERSLRDGGNDIEGFLVGSFLPSYDDPRLADYVTALKRYVPGGIRSSAGGLDWLAGKLMERIFPTLPADPTSADLLEGLYSLKGETLGGLIPPLYYKRGAPGYDQSHCIFPLRVENGRFVAPGGGGYVCAPGWKPQA